MTSDPPRKPRMLSLINDVLGLLLPLLDAVIRVGTDFQADLPPFQDETKNNVQAESDRGVALWRPISESYSNDLDAFLAIAIERHGYDFRWYIHVNLCVQTVARPIVPGVP
ncbi:hypothetical protein FBUS_07047 [Fasciolopsis buskii]|uniref:ELM2 domain-containing protein n=1 Tax=Fasciolopsis buskii TaxID=27845 RepID=A0A8E0RWY5_9TREM|nr:hypothetical protein FBUS_07047 [Fasciolopsis buski]